MPSQHCRSLFETNGAGAPPETFSSAAQGTRKRHAAAHTEVIADVLRSRRFTPRVAARAVRRLPRRWRRGDPTAVTVASTDSAVTRAVQVVFNDSRFRVYTNDDVIGVELGGALKNIIAIAAGVCDGLGLGHNSVAALITRGLAKWRAWSWPAAGGSTPCPDSPGSANLVLTCTGDLSRNRSVGVELGKGRELPDIIAGMHVPLPKGCSRPKPRPAWPTRRTSEMPITEQMYAILETASSPAGDRRPDDAGRPGRKSTRHGSCISMPRLLFSVS